MHRSVSVLLSASPLCPQAQIYSSAKAAGISLLTVSHRIESLLRFHDHVLAFDGAGGYRFTTADAFRAAGVSPMQPFGRTPPPATRT